MGDDNECFVLTDSVDLVHDFRFRFVVECRSRFVQHQHFRIGIKGSGDGDALLLAAAEFDATVTHAGLQSVVVGGQKIPNVGLLEHFYQALFVDRFAQCHVFGDGAVEEVDLLGVYSRSSCARL